MNRLRINLPTVPSVFQRMGYNDIYKSCVLAMLYYSIYVHACMQLCVLV